MAQSNIATSVSVFEQIAVRIIQEQEKIIGPIAVEQAQAVKGLKVDWSESEHSVEFGGDTTQVINELISRYSELFGRLSVEVCRSASSDLISQLSDDQIPKILT